jgi:hypothetical protein
MKSFRALWGEDATGDLSNVLSTSPTKNDYQKTLDRMHMMANKPTMMP